MIYHLYTHPIENGHFVTEDPLWIVCNEENNLFHLYHTGTGNLNPSITGLQAGHSQFNGMLL